MLNQQQIKTEVEKARHKVVDASNYKNLSSFIEVECENGHRYTSSVERLRKTSVCSMCTKDIVKLSENAPPKKGYRIVSIDQATNNAGVSIFDDGNLVYASQRSFFGDLNTRYVDFAQFLVHEVFNQWKPDEMVFEDIQFQNHIITFKTLAGLLGICTMLSESNKIPFSVMPNKVWQSEFYIKGKDRNTQKRATMDKVKELFNIEVNDDIADSVLMGYYRVIEKGRTLF